MIDAHIHFWDPARKDDILIVRREPSLDKRAMPEDLAPMMAAAGVTGAIAIQSAPNTSETEHLVATSARMDAVRGVVGWVDLSSGECAAQLSALAARPKVVGVRAMLNRVDGVDWLTSPRVRAGLAALAKSGLSLDLIARTEHVPAIVAAATAFPDLTMVVDHGASPPTVPEAFRAWQAATRLFAQHPQISSKFSGFAEEAPTDWTPEMLAPAFRHLLEVFGADRIMWASNWPVVDLRGGYARWASASRAIMERAGLSPAERRSIEAQTARRVYRIGAV